MKEEMTVISALDDVQEAAQGSQLGEDFWAECAEQIEFLTQRLELSAKQVLIVAILSEAGTGMTWRRLGEFLGVSRLKAMALTPEVEDLKSRRWVVQCAVAERGMRYEGFELVCGTIKAFRHNTKFVPERIDGLSTQEFVDKITRKVNRLGGDDEIRAEERRRAVMQIVEANPELPLSRLVLGMDEEDTQICFLAILADHVRYYNREDEGLGLGALSSWFDSDDAFDPVAGALQDGGHELFARDLISYRCQDEGLADSSIFVVSDRVKTELLAGYRYRTPKLRRHHGLDDRMLTKAKDIQPKELFYNPSEAEQMGRMHKLLADDRLQQVQASLKEQGLHEGIACLFYGTPGTGKTESVMQLARQTGRDIMQVEIAGLRDKFVGESEKNIKAVFARYKEMCRNSRRMPILLFNEADAIINSRLESTTSSVEKMDNAIQNIILQEMETMEGIMIATTNLTGNIDRAFDRRFLFKVEFHNPDLRAKMAIWRSKLPGLSDDDCTALAAEFVLSGGQIENVARKAGIDYALTGEPATLAQLQQYCREEHLNRTTHTRIGF